MGRLLNMATGARRGLGYAVGDTIGVNVDPGWSGPTIRIISLGTGDPVRWQTGGSANVVLPAYTRMQTVPPNGLTFELQPGGYLNSSGVQTQVAPPSGSTIAPTGVVTTAPDLPVVKPADRPAPSITPIYTTQPTAAPTDGGGNVATQSTARDASATAAAAPGGIPLWAWLLGGVGAVFLLSRKG